MFNMSKEKWFIAVADKQEAIAVQEFLLEMGYTWSGYGNNVRKDIDQWEHPYAIGYGHFCADSLGQASVNYWLAKGHLEIKVAFELRVVDIIVESEQQKQIKALESTIQMAQDQIQKIKEGL